MQICSSFICYMVNTSGIAMLNAKNDTLFVGQQKLDWSLSQSNVSDVKFWEAWPCSVSFRGPDNTLFFLIYGRLFQIPIGQDFKIREGGDKLQITINGSVKDIAVDGTSGDVSSEAFQITELTDFKSLRQNQINIENYDKMRGQYDSDDQLIADQMCEQDKMRKKEEMLEKLFGSPSRDKKPPKTGKQQFTIHLRNAKQNFVDMFGAIFYQNDNNNVQRKQLATANSMIGSYQKQIDVMKEQLGPVFEDADAENKVIFEAYKGYKRQLDYLEKLIHDIKVAKQMVLSGEAAEYTKEFYSYFDYSHYESML